MTQDINYIRNALKGFYEVKSIYDIRKGNIVKYITIDSEKEEEIFSDGGKFIKMGDNKMYIDNGKITFVLLKHLNPDGSLIYKTRLFIKNESEDIVSKDIAEYQKIINNQQNIIEGITKQNIKLKKIVNSLNEKNKKYEITLKKLIDTENNYA